MDFSNYSVEELKEFKTQIETLILEKKEKKAEKDVTVWLNYNKYKGTGKCWIAEIDPRTKKIESFLDAESVEKRDNYSGDKCFLVPLIEGKCYQFRESGSKSSDHNYYRKVENNALVEM